MTMTEIYYDPYDREIDADPYPVYPGSEKKLRSTTTSNTTSTPSVVSKTFSEGSSIGRPSVPLAARCSSSSRRTSRYRPGS